MRRIVATPEELDATDGWWKWDTYKEGPRVNVNSADKWLQPAGYVKDEVRRNLRRSAKPPKIAYRLAKPTLAAISKRLAKAELCDCGHSFSTPAKWEGAAVGFDRGHGYPTWEGPRAAERYIVHRRTELGLTLDMDFEPEPDYSEWDAVAALVAA